MKKKLRNWGKYPTVPATEFVPESADELAALVRHSKSAIARGLGRSYGDSSLGKTVVSSAKLNQIERIEGDVVICQSGVSLEEILSKSIPLGLFLPVTPGTKYVSVGGAIAANIHGKNHHKEGCFGDHVLWLDLLRADGMVLRCSDETNQELFIATCGGMGLTGVIVRAAVRMKRIESSYISQELNICNNLGEMMRLFEEKQDTTYSVAWIDCFATGDELGRGVLFTGEHARVEELNSTQAQNPLRYTSPSSLAVPFNLPTWFLSRGFVRQFNKMYFSRQKGKKKHSIVGYEPFFYPLDRVKSWNKAYGRKGFLQYQFVLPLETSEEGLREILSVVNQGPFGSFLAVLKLFGDSGKGVSFPMKGYTLAMDFPVKPAVFELLDDLDQLVRKYKGRIYLAKDARMSASTLTSTYEALEEFKTQKQVNDPTGLWQSHQSNRLDLTQGRNMKKALILGATSDIAHSTAKEFAVAGYDLVLAGRDVQALEALKKDIETSDIRIETKVFDATDTEAHAAFYDDCGDVDVVLLAFGYLGDQHKAEKDFSEAKNILEVNLVGAVSILEIIAQDFERRKAGSMLIISSVAGDRGKRSNYIYGAAKSGLTEVAAGLRQRMHDSGVHVMTIKPGFVKTSMTEGMDLKPSLTVSAQTMGKRIFKGFEKRKDYVFSQFKWRVIMFVFKHVPEFIYKKMKV